MLFGIWVGANSGINFAATPVVAALVAFILGMSQGEKKAVGHKLAFLLVATFFISLAIYIGMRNAGTNLAVTITLPTMLALLCLIASCLDELKWDTVAVTSIPIFAIAGTWFDVRAWWFLIPPILFMLRNMAKENEQLNRQQQEN